MAVWSLWNVLTRPNKIPFIEILRFEFQHLVRVVVRAVVRSVVRAVVRVGSKLSFSTRGQI